VELIPSTSRPRPAKKGHTRADDEDRAGALLRSLALTKGIFRVGYVTHFENPKK